MRITNNVRLIGNVGADPEIIETSNGKKLAKVNIATNDSYFNPKGELVVETEWHRVVAWGNVAERFEILLEKGKHVIIEGKLVHRTYETPEGEKRYTTEVKAYNVLLSGGSKKKAA